MSKNVNRVIPVALLIIGGVAMQPVSQAQHLPEGSLHQRTISAIPALRAAFESSLNDYPTARFRAVRARLVRSVYYHDDGNSKKIPWLHRGGSVLVFCGEFNAKNRMGGFTGWQQFAFEPAQTDVVTWYDHGTPRQPTPFNLAEKAKLRVITGSRDDDEEEVGLLCGSDAEMVDAADLSDSISFKVVQ